MKYIFTITIIILSSFSSFSQTEFAPIGAKWTYKVEKNHDYEVLNIYEVDHVDTLPDYTVKNISIKQYRQYLNSGRFMDRDTMLRNIQLYAKNDTVFIYNSLFNKFTPIYYFNVSVGDTLKIFPFETGLSNVSFGIDDYAWQLEADSSIKITIDSIVSKSINGVHFNCYYYSNEILVALDAPRPISYDNFPSNNTPDLNTHSFIVDTLMTDSGAYVRIKNITAYNDLFGGISSLPWGLYQLAIHDDVWTIPVYTLSPFPIACYSDENGSFKINQVDSCESFFHNTPLSLKSTTLSKNLNIYPNPAQNTLHIDLDKPTKDIKVKIVNLLGKEVSTDILIKEQQNSIDISSFNLGIYLMILENEGECYYHKFVKQ